MSISLQMIDHFLYRCSAFSFFHHKKETPTYSPCIEWEYSYVLIIELLVLVEEIL
jgi:hypothetical protein